MDNVREEPSVSVFRNYLKINTMQPNPDYESCVKFLQDLADDAGLDCSTLEVCPGRVILWMTWVGTKPELPSIILNSHTDVVPVFPEEWKFEPFSAHKTEDGKIYARGSQDMKCVGIQYVEAIRRMKKEGKRFSRTIHITFVPDEEIGGAKGMKLFIESPEFKKLNAGFALDEGMANPEEEMRVFYGERNIWWVKVDCEGAPGHGSQFIDDTAGVKLRKVIDRFMDFRSEQMNKLIANKSYCLGDVTTVNFTMASGGIQPNVVPNQLSAVFDVRISPWMKLDELEAKIKYWCEDAGPNVSFSFLQRTQNVGITSVDPSDPWWSAFESGCKEHGVKLTKEIFPAATDSRYLRELGIPALGFSPMNFTPILLHDHNEFLEESVFLKGVDIYCSIISRIASVPNL